MPESTPADPIFNPADFKSVQLTIVLQNTTTQNQIREGRRVFGIAPNKEVLDPNHEDPLEVSILEFTENGLRLSTPSHTCAVGHYLILLIEPKNSKVTTIYLPSKVTEVMRVDPDFDEVELEVRESERSALDQLKSFFEARQTDILNYFEQIKG